MFEMLVKSEQAKQYRSGSTFILRTLFLGMAANKVNCLFARQPRGCTQAVLVNS